MVMVVIVVPTSTLRAACNIIILIIVTVMHRTSDWGLECKVGVLKFEPHPQKPGSQTTALNHPQLGAAYRSFLIIVITFKG